MLHSARALRTAIEVAARVASVLAVAILPSAAQSEASASTRQRAYEEAAAEYGVPVSLLLAVSYLQSRWDSNAGTPSTTGGYGPMHLTDAARFLGGGHHDDGREDPRGDETRPLVLSKLEERKALPESMRTLEAAAILTGAQVAALETDPATNIRGGAAILAQYQRELGAPLSADPRDWYGAVARYGGATDEAGAARYADEVYGQLAAGADRITDDGSHVTLAARSLAPHRVWLARLQLPYEAPSDEVECPADLGCAWVPAPYERVGDSYGNYDQGHRSVQQKVEYIVIHDTEGSYASALQLVQDPTYVSWHFTLRSSDGHVAQHVKTEDVAWHAGNWYVNAKAIGLEHEGFAAQGTWYTEAMYRASAKLVRHLATLHRIPIDRAHIIGHDNVPGILPANVRDMHWDPGPYWDWSHYFSLLGSPLEPSESPDSSIVMVRPDFATHRPPFVGCDAGSPTAPCAPRGASSVVLRSEPSPTAPLVRDIGLHPDGSPSTMHVSDHGARASTGQRFVVAEVRDEWTAIWYLGQKAWLHNPPSSPTAVRVEGTLATPKPGVASIRVYGRAFPEPAAYPLDVPIQTVQPLQYTWPAGQSYVVGQTLVPEYYRTKTFDGSSPGDWSVVAGDDLYYQVQFGHRIMYVKASDVVTGPI